MGLRNRAAITSGYLLKNAKASFFPQEAAIEITNHCNLSCRMCPHSKMKREKGIMNYELFCAIIDQLRVRSEFVFLYGTGESLLVENFFDYASYAVKSGLKTCLSTNATMLSDDRVERLIDSGIDFIVLAIDGTTKETYDKIRKGAHFEETVQRCKKLLQEKIRKKSRTDVIVQFIMTEENREESLRLRDLFTPEQQRAINQFRLKPLYESYAQGINNVVHKHPCFFLWNFISIAWNGDVQLCCMDYDCSHSLGNVRSNSIQDIWNSAEIRRLRALHLACRHDDVALCRTCTLPEKEYFSPLAIAGSMFMNAGIRRKITPLFEKVYVLKSKSR